MNPQPDPMIGNIFATLFVLLVIVYTIKAIHENTTIRFNDNFVIGYIEERPSSVTFHVNTVKHEIKHKISHDPLYIDCIDALVALGMKKTAAKEKTKYIFETTNPKPQDIQSFLSIALKLPS